MQDSNGRNIDYVRISITDRCNLRCVYCMPESGVEAVPHEEILRYDEIVRLGEIFAGLGINKIKITGGEPLVRKGAVSLIKDLKQIPGISKVTLTTNGILLGQYMEELKASGIDGINLSLDTLRADVFQKIARRDCFAQVMEGLSAALACPEIPLKINCVPMEIEGQEPLELSELARRYPVHVRFIEMMPVGLGREFKGSTEDEILDELKKRYGPYKKFEGTLGNGPGHYYEFPGFFGKIGFISAITHKFCSSCNRIRLTSEGYLKTCLQYDMGADLKMLLRNGASGREIAGAVKRAAAEKPCGHHFGEKLKNQSRREEHMMSQIGG